MINPCGKFSKENYLNIIPFLATSKDLGVLFRLSNKMTKLLLASCQQTRKFVAFKADQQAFAMAKNFPKLEELDIFHARRVVAQVEDKRPIRDQLEDRRHEGAMLQKKKTHLLATEAISMR